MMQQPIEYNEFISNPSSSPVLLHGNFTATTGKRRPPAANDFCFEPEIPCYNVLKKRRVSLQKSVSFASSEPEIIPYACTANDSSIKQLKWHTREDYRSFRLNIRRDVLYLSSQVNNNLCQHIDFTEYSFDGIEKFFMSSNRINEEAGNRKQRLEAVLGQQQLQKFLGISDPETICVMAQMLSETAKEEALARAQLRNT